MTAERLHKIFVDAGLTVGALGYVERWQKAADHLTEVTAMTAATPVTSYEESVAQWAANATEQERLITYRHLYRVGCRMTTIDADIRRLQKEKK